MLTYVVFFQGTSGCVTWPYITEVTVDAALGVVGFSGYLVCFILSFSNQPLIESGLHSWGTFWLYGIMCLIATVWMFIYMKETKHLNDKQKKTLYVPEGLLD